MEAPDKLYIGRRNYGPLIGGWVLQPFRSQEIESIEYIRKEALLGWVKEMKRICRGAEPIEKAYQTIIDKLNSM